MDLARYRDILQECFPHLDVASIAFIGGGSFRVFEVQAHRGADKDSGSTLIFRFPHGGRGDALLRRERVLCDALAAILPVPVPRYEFYSDGCSGFPWPVAGYRKLAGTSLEDLSVHPAQAARIARQIGEFLSALHSVEPTTLYPFELPVHGPAEVQRRQQALYDEVKQQAYPVLSARERAWTSALFESFLSGPANHAFKPVLIHGDLDSSNILCDPAEWTLKGIIDFEDACMGDPASDFCVLVAEHGPMFLQEMLRAYRPALDGGFRARVAFHSKRIIYHELLYGLSHNDDRFSQSALKRLHRAMDGEAPIGGWLAASTAETRQMDGFPS
jgi:aminoglycoside 2''-phosphotransferase